MLYPATAFDHDRRHITRIDADLGALSTDPHMHVVTTVVDWEAQRTK